MILSVTSPGAESVNSLCVRIVLSKSVLNNSSKEAGVLDSAGLVSSDFGASFSDFPVLWPVGVSMSQSTDDVVTKTPKAIPTIGHTRGLRISGQMPMAVNATPYIISASPRNSPVRINNRGILGHHGGGRASTIVMPIPRNARPVPKYSHVIICGPP